ncbi:YHYH domain-containing protein [Synechococcus elongatus]|uniref:YHYH domain-containing protein n=1 Tax=Synechococcus elongatus PCC 11802 TaxID=2283154 RepID=A0AAT9JWC8_SYNEL|nr:YHYH domain-containing protein [Synechococcus elongatus]QFZ92123.1 YHYH domain-containing protein [Synechococcus elongatus PCC 11802]
MRWIWRAAVIAVILTSWDATAIAHSSNSDVNQCHHDRRTGEYHCH